MQAVKLEGYRFEALDSWRGIAALAVSLLHLYVAWTFIDLGLVRNATLFVDFFFVLSGFVVSHAYTRRLHDRRSALNFAIRRFGRLWPNHVAVLILFVLFQLAALLAQNVAGITLHQQPFTGTYAPEAIVSNLLLIQPLGVHDELTWNRPSWSIAVEFWTYLLFALLVVLWPKRAVATSIIAVTTSLIIVAVFSDSFMNVGNNFGLFRCMAGFFFGVLAYRFFLNQPKLRMSGTIPETIVVLVAGLFVWYAEGATTLLAPLVFAVGILIFASEDGLLSKLLKTKPLLFLGKMSFSIYIIHSFVHLVLFQTIRLLGQRLALGSMVPGEQLGFSESGDFFLFNNPFVGDVIAGLYVAAVIVSAFVLRTYVEEPAQKLFIKFADAVTSSHVKPGPAEQPVVR